MPSGRSSALRMITGSSISGSGSPATKARMAAAVVLGRLRQEIAAEDDRAVVARQRVVVRIARQAGDVEPGLLRHLARHVEIDVDLAARKIHRARTSRRRNRPCPDWRCCAPMRMAISAPSLVTGMACAKACSAPGHGRVLRQYRKVAKRIAWQAPSSRSSR